MRGDAEALRQLEQQPRLILQQRDLELVGGDPRVVAADARQAIGELARRLDAGEAAADHDEVAQSPPRRGVGLELDLRDAPQHHVADVHRVADRLERQRMLGEAGNQVEPRAIAERKHQVLVANLAIPGERGRRQRARGDIDSRYPAHDEPSASEHLLDRCHRLLGEDRRTDRFGQHRVERCVALLAYQDELVATGQPAVERPG